MSILDKQLVELVKRVNVSGDPHARIAKPAWFNRLRQDLVGTPERNEANIIIALTSDVAFAGVLAFDDFSQEIVVRQPLPWDTATGPFPRPWEDADDVRTAEWLQLRGVNVAPLVVGRAVAAVAREHRIHPVRDWLEHLRWDGTPRIETWTSIYLGAAPTPYTVSAPAPVASRFTRFLLPQQPGRATGEGTHHHVAVLRQVTEGEQRGAGGNAPDHQHAQVLFAAHHHGQQKAAHHHVQPQALRVADRTAEMDAQPTADHPERPERQAATEHGLDGELEGEAAGCEQGLESDGHEADLAGCSGKR